MNDLSKLIADIEVQDSEALLVDIGHGMEHEYTVLKVETISAILSALRRLDAVPLRELLDWWMCSDPFLAPEIHTALESWLNAECVHAGYENWVVAYHEMPRPLAAASGPKEGQ